MPLIIPIGFGQAVYNFTLTGDSEPMACTMGHDLSAVTGGEFQEAADGLLDAFGTFMMGLISNQYQITGVTLYVGQDGGPPAIYESTGTPITGGELSQALPQNCAYLLRKRTSAAGRRGRGRMYIPGVDETQVTPNGEIDGSWVTTIQASADDWLGELEVPTLGQPAMPPVVLHRSEGAGTEPPPTPITALVFDDVIATQRRRLRK